MSDTETHIVAHTQLVLTDLDTVTALNMLAAATPLAAETPETAFTIYMTGDQLVELMNHITAGATPAETDAPAPAEKPAETKSDDKPARVRLTKAEKEAGLDLEQVRECREKGLKNEECIAYCQGATEETEDDGEEPEEDFTLETEDASDVDDFDGDTEESSPAETYERSDVANLIRPIWNDGGKGKAKIQKLFGKFGVEGLKQLPEDKYADFVEAVRNLG